jgi:hypothetical protein
MKPLQTWGLTHDGSATLEFSKMPLLGGTQMYYTFAQVPGVRAAKGCLVKTATHSREFQIK